MHQDGAFRSERSPGNNAVGREIDTLIAWMPARESAAITERELAREESREEIEAAPVPAVEVAEIPEEIPEIPAAERKMAAAIEENVEEVGKVKEEEIKRPKAKIFELPAAPEESPPVKAL
jgi:hypothetical protein